MTHVEGTTRTRLGPRLEEVLEVSDNAYMAEDIIPFVESLETFFRPDLGHDVGSSFVSDIGVVDLQSSPDDLVWVRDAPSEHFADGAESQEVHVGEPVFAAPARAPMVLELFVGHELDSAMADAE